MVKYRIFETDQFIRDMERNFNGKGEKLRKKLIGHVYPQLRSNPYFGKNIKKLRNYSPDTWRYRIGGYRFFYEIDDKEHIVFILTAESRKDSYK